MPEVFCLIFFLEFSFCQSRFIQKKKFVEILPRQRSVPIFCNHRSLFLFLTATKFRTMRRWSFLYRLYLSSELY
jgi:hypothetical protein